MTKTISVAAAVIRREDGRILLARRASGQAFAGKWEFPGGKIEVGETPEQCLARELREELAIEVAVGAYVCSSRTEYPNVIVEMHAYEVWYGNEELHLTDHDAVAWAAPHDLSSYEVPEADIPIVERLMARPPFCGAPTPSDDATEDRNAP